MWFCDARQSLALEPFCPAILSVIPFGSLCSQSPGTVDQDLEDGLHVSLGGGLGDWKAMALEGGTEDLC